MADFSNRNPDNVPGRYYVDLDCIDCDQCRTLAPTVFERNPETGLTYVAHQPVTEEEIAATDEALDMCAVQSIGNDGVSSDCDASAPARAGHS